jgi:hypothetical protein
VVPRCLTTVSARTCAVCALVRLRQGSVYAYKSGKRIEDPFTPDTRISE